MVAVQQKVFQIKNLLQLRTLGVRECVTEKLNAIQKKSDFETFFQREAKMRVM